jgi:hypothetical protein
MTRVSVDVPSVAFKGPHETDAQRYRQAAERLKGGYQAGGSCTRDAIAALLISVADGLDHRPAKPASPRAPDILGFQVQSFGGLGVPTVRECRRVRGRGCGCG